MAAAAIMICHLVTLDHPRTLICDWKYFNCVTIDRDMAIWKRRRTRQGSVAPQTRANPLLFGQKLNFSGRNQQPKWQKNCIY